MTWGDFRPSENKAVADSYADRAPIRDQTGRCSRQPSDTIDYVGAAVLVRSTRPKLLLSDKSLRLKPKPGIDPRWLVEVLSSPRVRQQIAEKSTGNQESMRNISQAALLSVRIPLHDADQQARLADNLAERRSTPRQARGRSGQDRGCRSSSCVVTARRGIRGTSRPAGPRRRARLRPPRPHPRATRRATEAPPYQEAAAP